jgi:hypothetical protein
MVLWNSASESLSLLLEEAVAEDEVVENIGAEAEGGVGMEDLGATRPHIETLEGFRLRRLIAQMVLRNQCKMPKDLILILRDASSNQLCNVELLAFPPVSVQYHSVSKHINSPPESDTDRVQSQIQNRSPAKSIPHD